MKKMILAIIGMVFAVNVNAAESASEKINEIRMEQSALQDKALKSSDIIASMAVYKEIVKMDKEIEELIPSLLSEREGLRDKALACGSDVVKAMEITKKVIAIDRLLEEIGYEEPADDYELVDCVE
jgi:hypothetical protein